MLAYAMHFVERFVGLLTERRIRRGTFRSVRELQTAIRD
jgi:hypothetical protein